MERANMLYTEMVKKDKALAKAHNDNLLLTLTSERAGLQKRGATKCARECTQIINRLRKRNVKLAGDA